MFAPNVEMEKVLFVTVLPRIAPRFNNKKQVVGFDDVISAKNRTRVNGILHLQYGGVVESKDLYFDIKDVKNLTNFDLIEVKNLDTITLWHLGKCPLPAHKGTTDPLYCIQFKQTTPMICPLSLQDIRFAFDEYLLHFVDNGDEPLSFEEFVAEHGMSHLLPWSPPPCAYNGFMNNKANDMAIWCVQGGWDYEGMDNEIRLFASEALALQWEQQIQQTRNYDHIDVWKQLVLSECPEDNF